MVEIEDAYCEASEGLFVRVLITADDRGTLRKAAEDATATPSVVVGRVDAGIERWVSEEDTPDGRRGVILMFFSRAPGEGEPLDAVMGKFEKEFSYRIRQDILVKPFTAVFDALPNPEGKIDAMERIGHCGDCLLYTSDAADE